MANFHPMATDPPVEPTTPDGDPPPRAMEPIGGDQAARLAWLQAEVDRQLGGYRRRRRRDKHKAFSLQMATVTLSATITVLLGLRTTGTIQQRLADVALALGALVTVLAAAEAFFFHRGLWILRTDTVRRLEALARHLDYHRAGLDGRPPSPADVDHFRTELEHVLAHDQKVWSQLRHTTAAAGEPEAPSTTADPATLL